MVPPLKRLQDLLACRNFIAQLQIMASAPDHSPYNFAFPSSFPFESKLMDFIKEFYRTTDDPSAVESYLECFTEDAVVERGVLSFEGHQGKHYSCCPLAICCNTCQYLTLHAGLSALREAQWQRTESTVHRLLQLYPACDDPAECFISGTVDFVMREGWSGGTDYAARMKFTTKDGVVKLNSYKVYLVSRGSPQFQDT